MKFSIIIFVFIGCSIHHSCALEDILSLSMKLQKIVEDLTHGAPYGRTKESMVAGINDRSSKLGGLLGNLTENINEIDNDSGIDDIFGIIRDSITTSQEGAAAYLRAEGTRSKIRDIDSIFSRLRSHLENVRTTDEWKTFADNYIKIDSTIRDIRSQLLRNRNSPGHLEFIVAAAFSHPNRCEVISSMQYFLRRLFSALVLTEIKALIVSTYVHVIFDIGYDGPLRTDVYSNSKERFIDYVKHFKDFMKIVPKDLTACDPPYSDWIRDKNYFEMEGIEQAVIFHFESAFNSKQCSKAIENHLIQYDFERDICFGKLSDCENSGWLEVCRLQNNTKRYEWIRGTNDRYGTNFDKCPDGSISEYEGISNFFMSHCICKCRDDITQNWISLDPVKTDVANNMVMSGLRFVRKEGVLYMQVRQAKLLADGLLDENSHNWIPLPKSPALVAINSTNGRFYLDDVILPDRYLAVGVEFNHENGFYIGVTAHMFDFSAGQLLVDELELYSDHAHYKELVLPRRNSIHTSRTHKPDSKKNWVKLQMSDLKYDAGQSMLPLFDAGAVESSLPLEGIGMVHRGAEKYAGFISPRLFQLQYRKHLVKFATTILRKKMGQDIFAKLDANFKNHRSNELQ